MALGFGYLEAASRLVATLCVLKRFESGDNIVAQAPEPGRGATFAIVVTVFHGAVLSLLGQVVSEPIGSRYATFRVQAFRKFPLSDQIARKIIGASGPSGFFPIYPMDFCMQFA
jgi:hypothetical protein